MGTLKGAHRASPTDVICDLEMLRPIFASFRSSWWRSTVSKAVDRCRNRAPVNLPAFIFCKILSVKFVKAVPVDSFGLNPDSLVVRIPLFMS